MSTLVKLSMWWVHGPFVEGAEILRDELRYFSSLPGTEDWIRSHLDDPFDDGAKLRGITILWFIARVGETDSPWRPIRHVYNEKGELQAVCDDWSNEDPPFYGRRPEDCRWAPGEEVLVLWGRNGRTYLTRAVVEHQPLPPRPDGERAGDETDDTYLVVFPDGDHDHVHQNLMWKIGSTGP